MRTHRVTTWLLSITAVTCLSGNWAAAQTKGQPAKPSAAKIDLNTATADELEKLPGVGAVTAKKIIAGRPYKSVDDLKGAGISPAEIAKIAPLVEVKHAGRSEKAPAHPAGGKSGAVESPAKINLNTASASELEQLPGVGAAKAKKIIAGRPYKSVDDLKAAGLTKAEIAKIAPLVRVKAAASEAGPETEVDLNTATAEELQELPGIGEAYSKKIIAARPYKSVGELSRSGIPAATIAKITPMVMVEATDSSGKPAAAKAPPKPGMVWCNTDSKIFHKKGDRWYGKTQKGEWMTEADAIKAGYRAAK